MVRCNPYRRGLMSALASFLGRLSRWIDDAAAGLNRFGAKLRRGRRIELSEQADGAFLAAEWRKGAAHPLDEPPLRLEQDRFADPISARMRTLFARSRVDVMLAPSRFVIRTLELPRGASQFLEGVVRSQLDRLTPWSASDAVFGWSSPRDAGPDRIAVAVAATASALIAPIARALVAARCGSYPHIDDRRGRRRRHSGFRSAIGRRRGRWSVAQRPYHRPRPLRPRVRDEFRRLGRHRRRGRNALR